MYSLSTSHWTKITLLYMMLILASSTMPGSSGGGEIGRRAMLMNFLHIPAYAVLTFLLINTIQGWQKRQRHPERSEGSLPSGLTTLPASSLWFHPIILSFIIAVAFGILNEFVQATTPGREYSYGDMLRNALGSMLMLGWLWHLGRKKRLSS